MMRQTTSRTSISTGNFVARQSTTVGTLSKVVSRVRSSMSRFPWWRCGLIRSRGHQARASMFDIGQTINDHGDVRGGSFHKLSRKAPHFTVGCNRLTTTLRQLQTFLQNVVDYLQSFR